ncbi:MAG TPA: hypothetical protein VGM44_03545, partial [Polyangiaceae bacterium]
PNASHLLGKGNQLLETNKISFDVLGSIDFGGDYQDLFPDTEIVDLQDHPVRVLTLDKQIELKQKLTRPKDKFMLMQLEATRDEREKARQRGE